MPTYVAFLRAINLGAKRQFPKADIAAATERAGFTGVATHINTGNVRLETAMRSRTRIEAALERAYREDRGFEVPTMVVTQAELRAIAAEAAVLGEGHDGQYYVSLLKEEPGEEAAARLVARGTDQERLHVSGRAVHLLVGADYHTSRITNATVERDVGPATNRNLTVIRTLAEKWG